MIAWLCALALADPPRQFRQIALVDGRVLAAEIVGSDSDGLKLRLPQGEMYVEHTQIREMSPLDQAAYDAQEPWVVLLVVPEARRDQLAHLFDALPAVVVWTPLGVVGEPSGPVDLSDAEQAALRSCGDNLACLQGTLGQGAGWKWLITAEVSDETLVLAGHVTSGTTGSTVTVANTSDASTWAGIREILGLAPDRSTPDTEAPLQVAPPSRTPSGGVSVLAPIPGLPAFSAHDGGRGALALALALPATAGWVAATGATARSAPEQVGLGVVGFYAITVAANVLVARHP